MTKIAELIEFALENYQGGGHWVYECWGDEEYEQVLADCGGDVAKAKLAIERDWQLTNERAQDCSWG